MTGQTQRPSVCRGRRYEAGVGLIEVLVAVLVLSIGFLAIAALQARALATNNSAMERSMATVASYSILDSMRADIANAVNGSYNGTVTANACPAKGTTLATSQLHEWCTYELAPLGSTASTTGTVACAAAAGTNSAYCTVTIQFDDSHGGDSGNNAQQVVTQAML
ncbi:type IV pilus modification protein PilV [Dyella psychrodurans]|uniref:Type IV pilus modification protein PilV n=2 Tax=Dyella psychrodurans TaxID=1927960 RepID=A0A370XBB0_9GAMM|nr:type IV pilus modification protein PilV [Dyella psychrodurans]